MFVPLHRRRHTRAGVTRGPQGARVVAVLVAIFSTLLAAIVGSLLDSGQLRGSGSYVGLGLLIAAGAVVLGFVVGRAIGRQGKV